MGKTNFIILKKLNLLKLSIVLLIILNLSVKHQYTEVGIQIYTNQNTIRRD